MVAWVALLALQLAPLPASWVAALDLHSADGFPVISGAWATVSVDPYSTRLYLLKGLVLLAFFWLVLRLTTTPARVELLVKTMVLCGFVQAAAITSAAVTAAPAAAAAVVTAAVNAGGAPTVVQSAAIGAGADPTTVTTAAAAGTPPQAPAAVPTPAATAPGGTPVPGGGGS